MDHQFNDIAWDDYLYWQKTDKKILKRLNRLIADIKRTPFEGIGKPEQLKGDLSGRWARRITDKHRIVYRVEEDVIYIQSCLNHYSDK